MKISTIITYIVSVTSILRNHFSDQLSSKYREKIHTMSVSDIKWRCFHFKQKIIKVTKCHKYFFQILWQTETRTKTFLPSCFSSIPDDLVSILSHVGIKTDGNKKYSELTHFCTHTKTWQEHNHTLTKFNVYQIMGNAPGNISLLPVLLSWWFSSYLQSLPVSIFHLCTCMFYLRKKGW